MKSDREPTTEIVTLNAIRVETGFSRFPSHRVAKKGSPDIEIRQVNENGDLVVLWEVSHNSKHGQPGPLAYKLDTLIINRRIEETTRPISRIIRLGSLREITEELGLKTHNDKIKKALHQNASTYIKAKIRYRLSDGSEKDLEAGFTRYSVVFTGEKLPNGQKADAVYIVLNDVYMQVINGAMTRPLDYDYLKELAPGSQRFYEILSFQMYGAIKNDRPRAKLLYSEFCTYAPMTRHTEWPRVRSQMTKIHRPHFDSGYIAKVDYQDTTDSQGQPDWIMLYQPGLKARSEFRAFTKRGGPVVLEMEPFSSDPLPLMDDAPASPLLPELVRCGVSPAVAAELIRQYDHETIRLQVEHLDWLTEKKPGKVAEPAAWLVSAIKTNPSLPKAFESKADRLRRADAKAAKERAAAEESRRKRERDAREQAERQIIAAYWESLTPEQQAEHDATAIAQATPEDLKLIEPGPMKRIGLSIIREKHTNRLLLDQGKITPVTD
jgi:hypothetical protein